MFHFLSAFFWLFKRERITANVSGIFPEAVRNAACWCLILVARIHQLSKFTPSSNEETKICNSVAWSLCTLEDEKDSSELQPNKPRKYTYELLECDTWIKSEIKKRLGGTILNANFSGNCLLYRLANNYCACHLENSQVLSYSKECVTLDARFNLPQNPKITMCGNVKKFIFEYTWKDIISGINAKIRMREQCKGWTLGSSDSSCKSQGFHRLKKQLLRTFPRVKHWSLIGATKHFLALLIRFYQSLQISSLFWTSNMFAGLRTRTNEYMHIYNILA